jgi:hypothetical protein
MSRNEAEALCATATETSVALASLMPYWGKMVFWTKLRGEERVGRRVSDVV